MSEQVLAAEVYLWGSLVGYVSWDKKVECAVFEYDWEFLQAPIEPSPLKMPCKGQVYTFRDLK